MEVRDLLEQFIHLRPNWAFAGETSPSFSVSEEPLPITEVIDGHTVTVEAVLDRRIGSQGRTRDVGHFRVNGKPYTVTHWVEYGFDEAPLTIKRSHRLS